MIAEEKAHFSSVLFFGVLSAVEDPFLFLFFVLLHYICKLPRGRD